MVREEPVGAGGAPGTSRGGLADRLARMRPAHSLRFFAFAAAACVALQSCRCAPSEPPAQRVARYEEWERGLRKALASEVRSSRDDLVALEGPADPRLFAPYAAGVEVTSEALIVHGETLAQPGGESGAAAERLRDLGARYKIVHADRGGEPAFGIEAAADAPWSLVVTAAKAVGEAGAERVALVFAGAPPPPIPPSSASAEIAKAQAEDAEARWNRWLAALKVALKDCPSWLKRADVVGHMKPADQVEIFSKAAREALAARDCEVETAAVEAAMWGLAVNGRKQVGHKMLVLRLAKADGGAEIALPAATPWRDAAPQVVAAVREGKPVRLSVK